MFQHSCEDNLPSHFCLSSLVHVGALIFSKCSRNYSFDLRDFFSFEISIKKPKFF